MNGPQLLVLAAGLGRRFGGDKQIAEVGPAGEWLLDYSLYDARQAGFAEAVLVVRPDLTDLLDRPFPLPVKWVFQETPGTEWG
ncbi:MAG: NTP transferase domain-containing protein, partial [Saprospiraceae bacterium]|nr:NTP transferase domain-containing protein [Saprospiraceae bacterium]